MPAPPDDADSFIIHPLRDPTWAPRLAQALILYALFKPLPRWRLSMPYGRPKIDLVLSDDFDPIQRGELLDIVDGIWGRGHVRAPPGVRRLPRRIAPHLGWMVLIAGWVIVKLGTRHHLLGRLGPLAVLVCIFGLVLWLSKVTKPPEAPRRNGG